MPQQLRVVVLRMANGQIRKETGLLTQGDRLQHRHGHRSVDIRLTGNRQSLIRQLAQSHADGCA